MIPSWSGRVAMSAGTVRRRFLLRCPGFDMADITLVTLMDRFDSINNDRKCRDALERIRWPPWHLCHRIRDAMGNDPLSGPTLVGIVEMDQTLVGGRARKGMDSPWRTGYRESAESWAAVLRDLRARGLGVPKLLVADSHLGSCVAAGSFSPWPRSGSAGSTRRSCFRECC